MRRWLLVVAVMLVVPSNASALKQLPGKAGCVAQPAAPTHAKSDCSVARFADGPFAVSPDGRNIYAGVEELSVLQVTHGRVRRLPGEAGCVTGPYGPNSCKQVPQLSGATDIAVSPNGRSVYVGSFASPYTPGVVLTFARNPRSGALHNTGCVSEPGTGCAPARGLYSGVTQLLVSADGRTVYAASLQGRGIAFNGGIAVFARERNGKLSQLPGAAGCVNADGSEGCTQARGLGATCCGMTVSRDSRSVYISSSQTTVTPYPGETESARLALAAFARSTLTGALTQLTGSAGCVNRDGSVGCAAAAFQGDQGVNETDMPFISPNGRDVYLAHVSSDLQADPVPCGYSVDFLAGFSRDQSSGALGPLRQEVATCGLATLMSPDGRNLYTTDGVIGTTMAILSRNRSTGWVAVAGCIGRRFAGCREARHVGAPEALAMDRHRHLFVLSSDVDERTTIAIFKR